jgi:hypothetical protein
MIRQSHQRGRQFGSGRVALVFVSAVLYLAAAGGIPLPAPAGRTAGNAEIPFPCQHHACGCHDADQCWRDCCCFTQRQRLAWAARHHVHLPDEIERQLSMSAARPAHACCAPNHGAHDKHAHGAAVDNAASPPVASNIAVFGNLVRHCRGLDSTWLAGVPVLPVAAAVEWQFELFLTGHLEPVSPRLMSVVLPADTPPPRV